MPLVSYSLACVQDILAALRRESRRAHKVLCLANPDIIASPDTLLSIFGDRVRGVRERDDAAEIVAWHKSAAISKTVFETGAFFKALDCELHCIDLVQARGDEIIANMNFPWRNLSLRGWPSAYDLNFDLVYDNISHQVFNLQQCWKNALDAARVGGYILSVTPLNAANNGFWNVSPTAYQDFFPINGGEIVSHEVINGFYDQKGVLPLEKVRRMKGVPDEAVNVVVIKKLHDTEGVTFPIMTKFKQNPTSKRDAK